MAISFYPNPGTILVCDYSGFEEPEMVKTRPVVIVSPRSRHNGLATVVPISTTAPAPVLEWHYKIELTAPLSPKWLETRIWIKCDMINTFHISRLDRFHAKIGNARKYYDRKVSDDDLLAIRRAIAAFLRP